MDEKIDIAVCYHKPSMVFQSDALKPMQLGKAEAKIDLGFRSDDTGDNISAKNKYYAEDTAFYWLWKNSDADIKGIMHYRRLLNLNSANGDDKHIALEDIKSPEQFVLDLGLDSKTISEIMKIEEVIVWKKRSVRNDSQNCNIEEQYKVSHIPEYLDYSMGIIEQDFPEIYPSAKRVLAQDYGHFANLCIMKAVYFDSLCEFKFGVLTKLEKMVDVNRPEITDGWQHTARYTGFIGERLTMFYVEYLHERQVKVAEYPIVTIAPKDMRELWDTAYYKKDTYSGKEAEKNITPVFGKDAVTAMLAANNGNAPYCGVMLQSIIENANPDRNYDLVVLSRDIEENNKKLLESMSKPNISVRVIYIHEYVNKALFDFFTIREHFSIETYFRFFIPGLFEKYNKVLYLDCDMAALRDIAGLYDTDIGDNWWGVTHEINLSVQGFTKEAWEYKNFMPYLKNNLKVDSPFFYFQAGVMIWNINQCNKDGVTEKLTDRLAEIGKPFYADQDVMNSVANGKNIYWISNYWNVPWHYQFIWPQYKGRFAYDTVIHQLEKPFIIHFSGGIKPWREPSRPNARYFWQYARNTPFYETLLHDMIYGIDNYEKKKKEYKKRKITFRKIIKYLLPYGFVRFYQKMK